MSWLDSPKFEFTKLAIQNGILLNFTKLAKFMQPCLGIDCVLPCGFPLFSVPKCSFKKTAVLLWIPAFVWFIKMGFVD